MATPDQFLVSLAFLCIVSIYGTSADTPESQLPAEDATPRQIRDGRLVPTHTRMDDKLRDVSLLNIAKYIEKHQKQRVVRIPDFLHNYSFGKIKALNGKMGGLTSMYSSTIHQSIDIVGEPITFARHLATFDHLTFEYPQLDVIRHDGTELSGSAKVILERPFVEINIGYFRTPDKKKPTKCQYWFRDVTLYEPPRVSSHVSGLNEDGKLILEVRRRLEQHVVSTSFLNTAFRQAFDVFLADFCNICEYISNPDPDTSPLIQRVENFAL